MAYTILLLIGSAFMFLLTWLQGGKHWIKATINALIGLVFIGAAISRIATGNNTVFYPDLPGLPELFSQLHSLNTWEWVGFFIALSILVLGFVDWYRKTANRG